MRRRPCTSSRIDVLKKRHGIEDERAELYAECDKFVNEALDGRKFCGGNAPNNADLCVFGVLRAVKAFGSVKPTAWRANPSVRGTPAWRRRWARPRARMALRIKPNRVARGLAFFYTTDYYEAETETDEVDRRRLFLRVSIVPFARRRRPSRLIRQVRSQHVLSYRGKFISLSSVAQVHREIIETFERARLHLRRPRTPPRRRRVK